MQEVVEELGGIEEHLIHVVLDRIVPPDALEGRREAMVFEGYRACEHNLNSEHLPIGMKWNNGLYFCCIHAYSQCNLRKGRG